MTTALTETARHLHHRPWRRDTDPAPRPVWWLIPATTLALTATILTGRQHPGTLPALVVFTLCAGILAAIDIDVHRIPTRCAYATVIATGAGIAAQTLATGHPGVLIRCVLCSAATTAAWWLLALITRGFGLGDVRLGAATGLVTGWTSWGASLTAALLALVIGGIIAGGLKITRPNTTHLPFAPAMLLGALITIWGVPPT